MRTLLPYYIYIISLLPLTCLAQRSRHSETLGKAIEYFGGGKYHEAMLEFEKLKEIYTLNPRFEAYLGVCYYKENDYEKAARTLCKAIPSLSPFPPQERATYYFTCAESLFMLCRYDSAEVYYEKTLPVCRTDEQGDVYFRLAFCSLFAGDYGKAADRLRLAAEGYDRLERPNAETKARKKQAKVMLKTLLVSHGAGRMDVTDEETRHDKHHDADDKDSDIDKEE